MTTKLAQAAWAIGHRYGQEYRKETGVWPCDDQESIATSDWDSTAWGESWPELDQAGAAKEDYSELLEAWRSGFFATLEQRDAEARRVLGEVFKGRS